MQEKETQVADVAAEENKGQESYFASLEVSKIEQTLEEMMKAGVHFGHQKARRNPKMDEYIFKGLLMDARGQYPPSRRSNGIHQCGKTRCPTVDRNTHGLVLHKHIAHE